MARSTMLGGIAIAALVTGCMGSDIETLRETTGDGSAFNQALTEQYKEITVFEADRMYDWFDAGHFARKGLAAADGETVPPEAIESRDLPADKVGELTAARVRLLDALSGAAAEKLPRDAASAQGNFDCWIEQQEENHQPVHIAACREEFFVALGKLEKATAENTAAMVPAAVPAAAPAIDPDPLVVYFAFDSANLSSDADQVIEDALGRAGELGISRFSVTGHADRAGTQDYNLKLSLRRAEAIKDALTSRGVAPTDIELSGLGETSPVVDTPDGAREASNRRVEIIIQ